MSLSYPPVFADRIRKVPRQFSWIDHRLVREYRLDRCSHGAHALYLFLVTVSDARGISYYSDRTLCQRLNMDQTLLNSCRRELEDAGLIGYRRPVSQILPLDVPPPGAAIPTPRTGQMTKLKDILIHAASGQGGGA